MLFDRLGKEVLLFDGAMGTQLQEAGLKSGELPEVWNITNPERLVEIHSRYLEAGSDFITTNTFGCNRYKMKDSGYRVEDLILAAVHNAEKAREKVGKEAYIVLDIGPIGQLLKPMGTLSWEEAYDVIKQQVVAVKDRVDAVLLETMSDLYEVKAGVLAVKENSDLPVFVSMTYEANGRTLSGCDTLTMVNVLEGLHVDALGVNCSLGPKELSPIINEILSYAHVPVLMQPNAGLPCLVDGKTCYHLGVDEFVEESIKHVKNGVAIIGGCCGTTPEFIRQLREALPEQLTMLSNDYVTRVSSGVRTVEFGKHVVVCGERLNPTGKKKLKLALQEKRYEDVVKEAVLQNEANAHVLDVNVGVAGIEEDKVMPEIISLLQEVITLPLQIDSSHASAIEAACRIYNGKPLINSVNGKEEVMEAIFPIVKKYGGVVVALTLDENGIPAKAEDRFEIAKRIIKKAANYGIHKKDIIVDALVLTVSAQQKEVFETIKAVSMIKTLGVHTVLGVSNVSFGLPKRPLLNRTFLSMAMAAGLDMPIMNPLDEEMMSCVDAFNVLYNYDKDAQQYIQRHSDGEEKTKLTTKEVSLSDAVLHGLKKEAVNAVKKELAEKDAMVIINEVLIPALNHVGKLYEENKIYLPQLIQSAEASKEAFSIIKESFVSDSMGKGPIILATVEGDIHDIGKNIVKVVLESYGYQVIDLGKDVAIEKVVEAYYTYHPKAIGLSALMTTTVLNMKKTIEELRKIKDVCPIWVGGAVLNPEFAIEIGADYYTKDAMESVELLEKIIQ